MVYAERLCAHFECRTRVSLFEISLVGNVIHVETVEPSMVTKDVTLS